MKHRDSEKDKKMFGTLIIQPPSTHTGGELVVYEANGKSNSVRKRTGANSRFTSLLTMPIWNMSCSKLRADIDSLLSTLFVGSQVL